MNPHPALRTTGWQTLVWTALTALALGVPRFGLAEAPAAPVTAPRLLAAPGGGTAGSFENSSKP